MFEVLPGGKKPELGTEFSACVDLFAREDVVIGAGETVVVPLGVKIDEKQLIEAIVPLRREHYNRYGNMSTVKEYYDFFRKSHMLKLHIRSSLALKHGLTLMNNTGIIDLDYPDEIGAIIHKPIKISDIPFLVINAVKKFFASAPATKKDIPLVSRYTIKAGDKIAQIELCEHKTYLMGYTSDKVRDGGYGSTDKEVE